MKDNHALTLRTMLSRISKLLDQQNSTDVEIGKLLRLVDATVSMLPPETAQKWKAALKEILGNRNLVPRFSLAGSILQIIEANEEVALTVSDIKDTLGDSGFSFNSYTSNPLSSISTTLRRMVEKGKIHTAVIDGVNVYYSGKKRRQLKTIDQTRRKK